MARDDLSEHTDFFVRIQAIIDHQAPTVDGWICPDCAHYETGVRCGVGFFISVVGANMKGCPEFTEKLHKPEERKEWKKNSKQET